ncbi:MAG: TetR family transcriptional regulator [Bryobacteraceae bacterium]|nr:TetR family transcriptional regulator [Bryobacteraceae bacterium]
MSGSQYRILDAAERIIVRDGVARLTLDAVAAEAQMSKGGVLYHFKSKEDLIVGMIKRMADQYDEQVQELESNDPNPKGRKLRAMLRVSFPEAPTEAARYADSICAGLVAAVATNRSLLEPIHERARQMHTCITEEARDPVTAMIVHYAADGIWLNRIFGIPIENGEMQRKVVKRLLEMSKNI